MTHTKKTAKKKRAVKKPVVKAAPVLSVGDLMVWGAQRLQRARLAFGHGTENPLDEAAALVFHALKLDHADAPAVYLRDVSAAERVRAEKLIKTRIAKRIPSAYLTGYTWFAGLEFKVDERVLIPRSPIAELIERRFEPWIDPARVRRILDIGTGSGCIALACAHYLPKARVDGVDISTPALTVARANARHLKLQGRTEFLKSDHFAAVAQRRYDIIVSNPPYVGAREMKSLPAEYRHEPKIALASGPRGLDSVTQILAGAKRQLKPGGILVVEVGNTQPEVERHFPALPFIWLEFERGGGGVFLLRAADL